MVIPNPYRKAVEMAQETHTVTLVKLAQRSLQENVIEKNIETLSNAVNNRSLNVSGWYVNGDGWSVGDPGDSDGKNVNYRYNMTLTVTYESRQDKAPDKNVLAAILRSIDSKAAQPAFGRWTLCEVDGDEYVAPDPNSIPMTADFIGYSEVVIPDNFESYFDHLYGLDPHVGRLRAALEAGVESGWRHRNHQALIGPPGCGKSDIALSLKAALGEDAVMEFDATATTAAGAIKELAEREILPRILIVEEIEKADEKALNFLLAVMDMRAEIRKTTARATIQRDTKLFVVATVNNEDRFNQMQAGALASRFNNPIYFKRPTRTQLGMILQREIAIINGDFAWVDPTLDYCDAKGITDPRTVLSICVCGRDKLLTGEWQEMLEATSKPTGPPPADPGYPAVSFQGTAA